MRHCPERWTELFICDLRFTIYDFSKGRREIRRIREKILKQEHRDVGGELLRCCGADLVQLLVMIEHI